MTVNSTPSVKTYTGNAVTTAFSTVFQFIAAGDINVYLDGVLKTITTHYTVSGGSGSTGTVTFLAAPATDVAIVLERLVDYVQETDYADFDGNPAVTTETQFDLTVMMIQQLREVSERALSLPVGTIGVSTELTLAGNEGKYLRYNAAGDAFEFVAALDSEVAVSTFMETVLDDLTAAAARATLGVNLPAMVSGDAGKTLLVNTGGTGFDLSAATIAAQISTAVAAAVLARSQIEHPIGSWFVNKTDNTNPATILGFGTWVAETDKFIVSRGSTFTTNGGATTAALDMTNLPTTITGTATFTNTDDSEPGATTKYAKGDVSAGLVTGNISIANSGGGQSFSIIPSYQTYYIWVRTA